jgi:hypothetical protein
MVYIEWTGESAYTQDQLLYQEPGISDNSVSTSESEILAILKKHENALSPTGVYMKLQEERRKKLIAQHPEMTDEELDEKLQAVQSKDALEKMLKRKAEQGVLIRPSRGLYTYRDNPLYTETDKTKNAVGSVGYVGYVGSGSGGENRTIHDATTEMDQTDITDITDRHFDNGLQDDHTQRKILTLPTSVARCETRFDSQMSEAHEPGQTLTTDTLGNNWCEHCEAQRKLMDLGHANGWISTIFEVHGGKVKLQSGQEKYFKFARTSGHRLVSAALAKLEAMKKDTK